MQLSRSVPYFTTLLKAPITNRMRILRAFPTFVIDDKVEILYNVILGKVSIGSRKHKLMKYQKSLLNLVNNKSKNGRRRVIYDQNGGFLGALIPIILSLATQLV